MQLRVLKENKLKGMDHKVLRNMIGMWCLVFYLYLYHLIFSYQICLPLNSAWRTTGGTRTTVGETMTYSILVPHFLCEISGSHGGWYEGDSLLLYSAV
jgi:hypothetical protein